MKKTFYSFVVYFLILCSSVAFAGPFGINMGTTISQLNVKEKMKEGVYRLKTVPEPHPIFNDYIVFVAPKNGVFCIRAGILPITTSRYGSELKSKFDAVHEKISKKYGHSQDFDFLRSGSIWNNPEDFMMGLRKKERTLSSYWDSESGSILPKDIKSISLEANAFDTNNGFIVLQYDFSNTAAAREEINKKTDTSL